jgi:hypothetical protein
MDSSDPYISIEIAVGIHGDQLALRIPLADGGQQLASLLEDPCVSEDGFLLVPVAPELSRNLRLSAGDLVVVDSFNSQFNITRADDMVSIEGPIELHGDQLALRIPLEAGGQQLAPYARGIGSIEDGVLVVVVKPWMAERLNIALGSLVFVHNRNGRFSVTRSAANDE